MSTKHDQIIDAALPESPNPSNIPDVHSSLCLPTCWQTALVSLVLLVVWLCWTKLNRPEFGTENTVECVDAGLESVRMHRCDLPDRKLHLQGNHADARCFHTMYYY